LHVYGSAVRPPWRKSERPIERDAKEVSSGDKTSDVFRALEPAVPGSQRNARVMAAEIATQRLHFRFPDVLLIEHDMGRKVRQLEVVEVDEIELAYAGSGQESRQC